MKNILTPLLLLLASLASAEDRVLHSFRKLQLSEHFWSEGASFGDFNRDGKMDIVSGPYWYEGPDFKTRHEFYPASQTFKRVGADGKEETIPGFEGALGTKNTYSDNFFAFVRDFNADGWPDVLIYGFPGKDASWFENPQGKDGAWKRHVVFDQVDNESPTFADIHGDGKPDIVCNSGGYFGYAAQESDDPSQPWKFHPVSPKGLWARFTHGLGLGDVTGDGKPDIIEASGVWEQPASLAGDPAWKKHPAPFGNGAQFYAYDVSADGLPDVIGSLAAHGYGLAWWEQVRERGAITFRRHLIMGDKPTHNRYEIVFSQLHALDLADIDGDGLKDIVTGKRFWAHGNHGDPEPNAPAVSYWFQLVRQGKTVDFIPHLIDNNSGVGTQVVAGDVNGDSLPDVVVGNKKGTFVLLHEKKTVSEAEWAKAQPKANPAFVEHAGPLSPPAPAAAKAPAKPAAAPDTRLVRETDALTPEAERAALHVPPGFEVQLFAAEPQINKPINLALDAKGRVWVSSTYEYPYAAAKERWSDPQGTRVKDSRDAIKILEDTNGDGRADKVTDFADGLNIPTGVLPWHKPEHKAGCIAWSIPNIWYFADTDGDDKADVREVLFGPLGYEKDTHGMCSSFRLGADGWVYATHGFSNTSHFKAKDGSGFSLNSGNVFRFKPDGSRVEKWTHGQVNPFGLAWDRRGNLYSADCHSSPVYQLIRGACYPSFGKPHDGLGFAPVMCEHSHGSTGICGIVYIDGGIWGPEWDDHTLLGNVVTSRVNHDLVTFTGSTPRANERPDFVTSDDPWFRPVDLTLGADGALYIADFYNKIIGHYEVPLTHPGRDKSRGRIWRIVKKSGVAKRQPAPLPDLADWRKALADPSPFVQRAVLAKMLDAPNLEALPLLVSNAQQTPAGDASLVLAYRIAIRDHLKLPGAFAQIDPASNAFLAEIAAAVPTAEAAAFLFQRWQSGTPITPAVLTHIARHGDPALLPQAIALARNSATAPVELIRALDDGISERGTPPPPELRAWAQEVATQLLDAAAKKPAPSWVVAGEAKWALQVKKLPDGTEATSLRSMAKGGPEERLTGTLTSKTFPAPAKLVLWINGHRGFPADAPHEKNLVRVVDAGTGNELARAFPPRHDIARRFELDLTAHAGKPVRLELVDGDTGNAYAWLGIARTEPPVVTIADFQSEDTTSDALKTLAAMLQHSAPAALREQLTAYLPPRPASPPLPVSPEQRKQLDALIAARTAAFAKAKPNLQAGANIFKANCAACHQIKSQGGLIGPQLDGIGARGAARLCEDILDPNRNVDAHFHLHTFTLKDGSVFAGFLKAELGQVSLLVDATGKEHRIAKANIAKSEVTPMSLMPAAFGQMLTEAAFNDLLGYLLGETAGK